MDHRKRAPHPNGAAKTAKSESAIVPVVVSLLVGVAVCFGALCGFASLMLKADFSPELAIPLAMVAGCLGAAAAAAMLGWLLGHNGLSNGFFIGAGVCILLIAASFLEGTREFSFHAILKLVALCSAGALGGAGGCALKTKSRRIR